MSTQHDDATRAPTLGEELRASALLLGLLALVTLGATALGLLTGLVT